MNISVEKLISWYLKRSGIYHVYIFTGHRRNPWLVLRELQLKTVDVDARLTGRFAGKPFNQTQFFWDGAVYPNCAVSAVKFQTDESIIPHKAHIVTLWTACAGAGNGCARSSWSSSCQWPYSSPWTASSSRRWRCWTGTPQERFNGERGGTMNNYGL